MIRSDERWRSLPEAFLSAALDGQSWEAALQGLADATGSRSAQLTGIDSSASVIFNVMTNIDPAAVKLFAANAAIDPRVRIANEAPVLEVIAESACTTPDESQGDSFCRELARVFDVPFICMTNLERHEGTVFTLAVVRSQREGHITTAQRAIFSEVAPHVRNAVRTRLALERNGTAVVVGAMDGLGIPAFVCDYDGHIKALTQAAKVLIDGERGLQLKEGKLHAVEPDDARALHDAIDAAAAHYARLGKPVQRAVIIRRGERDASPVVLDVFTMPSQQFNIRFLPRVLIVARGARGVHGRRAAILRAMYALTPAESEIAQNLAEGRTAEFIARSRGVVTGTVRAQIKAILAKVGVSRQVELTARLNEL
jgi:DNA-binding CsgD family transcriptional regulator